MTDLALNCGGITLIHETTIITIIGLQCFLCLLHVVCLSVCILETRCVWVDAAVSSRPPLGQALDHVL